MGLWSPFQFSTQQRFKVRNKMFGKHSFDLEKQFVFYASYHNTPINVAIHILCIWPILATGLVLFQYTPEFMAAPELLNQLSFASDCYLYGCLRDHGTICWYPRSCHGFHVVCTQCQNGWDRSHGC